MNDRFLNHEQPRSKKSCRCKCKYKMRWFYSKGAFLVLIWVLLCSTTISLIFRTFQVQFNIANYSPWLFTIPLVVGILTVLPVGWLANSKFGVYNMFKFGHIVLFIGTLFASVLTLSNDIVGEHITLILGFVNGALQVVGGLALIIPILQLGLDQMPVASSSNITSFVVWIVFCAYGGMWISSVCFVSIWFCGLENSYSTSSVQLWSLLPVSCMSIVVITDFLFSKKWLIVEPKTSHTLKLVYQVLKFAWKHKSPLNRSALTYWEENVPSRMDLGKSRFGGPFTTEQVEDVKIVLRLLVLSLPLWVLILSENAGLVNSQPKFLTSNWTMCNQRLLKYFTHASESWILITTVLFEFVIYPIVRDRLPSIMKRIGIIAFFNFVLNVVFLTLSLVSHLGENEDIWTLVLTSLFYMSQGIQNCLLFCAILELICAQVPYYRKGFFMGCIGYGTFISIGIEYALFKRHETLSFCTDCDMRSILLGVKSCVSLIGLVFYCLLAHWYKMRVRDEEYCTQQVVEEVYDRYLSARVGN